MTTEPTIKLYAISMAALHEGGSATAVGVQSVVAALPQGVSVEEAWLNVARSIFPEADGWGKHYSTA